MKTLLKILLAFAVLGAAGAASYKPVTEYIRLRNKPDWRTAEVKRGDVKLEVEATGEVKPILAVSIGSFVSGPVQELHAEFNQEVTEGQLLAKIDPRLYRAAVARDQATLATREAEVVRVESQLKQAQNNEQRAINLRARRKDYVAEQEMDQLKATRESLEAQLLSAEAAVKQAQANLENSETNLEYTEITSPVSGIIIDRKIDPGQTLAAQFQTPELFVVGKDMRRLMHVHALVDETDIGMIIQAKADGRPVEFVVDAYPDDVFNGSIEEVRFSASTNQNVVTYPVIVGAANPDLKLIPGMTANLKFLVDEKQDVLRIPNSALRFFPDIKNVREQDRKLLEIGVDNEENSGAANDQVPIDDESEEDTPDADSRRQRTRHVWVEEGLELRAVEVVTGVSDHMYTEVVSGDIKEGQKLVTGIKPKNTK